VLLNPASAEGAAKRRWRDLETLARAVFPDLEVIASAGPGDLRRVATALADGGEPIIVLAAGGDGTSHEVINGIADAAPHQDAIVGWIPIGSGNDMARSVGVPLRRPACLEWYRQLRADAIDLGRIRYRTTDGELRSLVFGNSFTLGIGAEVLRICRDRGKRLGGKLAYLAATIEAVARQRPHAWTAVIDGREAEITQCRLVAVTNGPVIGAGMRIAPSARLDDGQLDLTWVSELSRARTLALFPRIYWGGHRGHRSVRHQRVRALTIRGDTPEAFEVDGELTEGRLPIELEIVPRGLRIARGALGRGSA
jgi:YegS/Rv2252/BmrU family lipid kinase